MNSGKHVVNKTIRSSGMKSGTLLIAILLLVAFAVGGTVAYLVADTTPKENKFTPSGVPCEVTENVKAGVKTSVMVQNIGNTDAYIRVAVIANQLTDEKITGPADVSESLAGEGWEKNGDYWYWTQPVAPTGKTGELLKTGETIKLEGIQVTVVAEAIQSDGVKTESGEKAVQEAWGVDPSTLKTVD